MNDPEQMARAGNYVLGLMKAHERERAEHDLEVDAGFREAVVSVAERMHLIDTSPAEGSATGAGWDAVARGIGGLPHMRHLQPLDVAAEREAAAEHAASPAPVRPARRLRAKVVGPLLYALAGAALAGATAAVYFLSR